MGECRTDIADIPPDAVWLDHNDTTELAVKAAGQVRDAGFNPDLGVILGRGGLEPGNIMARCLDIPAKNIFQAVLSRYRRGTTEATNRFVTGQFPPWWRVIGRKVLLVDDVWHEGHTLVEAKRRLRRRGARAVLTAVLHYKPEQNQTNEQPDFWAEETERWIVYPWEHHDELLRSQLAAGDAARARQVPELEATA